MSEIERFFKDLKEVPDSQPCSVVSYFSNEAPTMGYILAGADTPACRVKQHLLEVINYCIVAFDLSGIDHCFKKDIFEHFLE